MTLELFEMLDELESNDLITIFQFIYQIWTGQFYYIRFIILLLF